MFIFVSACGAQGPAFKKDLDPSGDRGLVYIYRPSGFCAGALSYQLSINGRSLTTIPSGGYTHFYVPPGSYTIEAYEPLNSGRYNSGLDIYAKETKFLELDPCPTGFPAMGGNILFERQSQIALKDIQKTKSQSASNPFRFKSAVLKQKTSISTSTSVEATVESPLPRASKGKAVVIPIGTIGNIKESQKLIINNKFLDELSSDYDIVPQEEYEKAEEKAFQELEYEECTEEQCIRLIQEMLQVENMFKLELIREDSDTQVSLTLIDIDKKIVKSHFCEGCKTSELIKVVSKLYKDLKAKM